jgi:hypothetical protein
MKPRKLLMFVLRVLAGVAVVLPFWYLFVNFVFAMALAPDPEFDFGDNYIMVHRHVYYVPAKGAERYWHMSERVVAEKVREFALSQPWLLGTTERGWFAVQKKLRQVHYPLSKEELQSITGLNVSSLGMETNPWSYVIASPEALAAKNTANRFCWVAIFAVPIAFGFAPHILRALGYIGIVLGTKGIMKLVYVCLWMVVSAFAWILCQGLDQNYRLDSNYYLAGWPGWVIKLDRTNKTRTYVLDFESAVEGFAVLDDFVIGKTYKGRWFAINRNTHEVWFPHVSAENLKAASGALFSHSQLTTSRPWPRMIIHTRTKIVLLLILCFFSIALIGVSKTKRSFAFLSEHACRLTRKPT